MLFLSIQGTTIVEVKEDVLDALELYLGDMILGI